MIKNRFIKQITIYFILFSLTLIAQQREGFIEGNLTDGPYIFYRDSTIIVKNCVPDGDKMKVVTTEYKNENKEKINFLCKKAGFEATQFSFNLKKELDNPTWEYPETDKIFAISDIEGNFAFFTKMLRNAGVIDKDFNWTFGNGHLVLIGDIFDRGIHVTECLWLLYSLEDKAKLHGGNVHVLLGNHDMMNLRGDLRYIENKYNFTTNALGISYRELFGVDSELGKWLRTKNTIVKIGKKLFVHAGLSKDVAETNLSIQEINDKMRDLMYINHGWESDKTLQLLAGSFGPMWYRGYFKDYGKKYKKATEEEVKNILEKYASEQIYVGHSIVKKPEILYNGKVIAVDVKHTADHFMADPENISWGVLIENNKLTRIDVNNSREGM